MAKRILIVALFLGVLAPASAFASFVCGMTYFPGSQPRVRLSITSGTDCTGSVANLWFCDPSSTATFCASTPEFRYTVPELLALSNVAARAAESQQAVFTVTTSCVGGTTGCGAYVVFNP